MSHLKDFSFDKIAIKDAHGRLIDVLHHDEDWQWYLDYADGYYDYYDEENNIVSEQWECIGVNIGIPISSQLYNCLEQKGIAACKVIADNNVEGVIEAIEAKRQADDKFACYVTIYLPSGILSKLAEAIKRIAQ